MHFKTWLQNELYLNPLFYDMTTPEGRAEYQRDKAEAEQMVLQRRQKVEVARQPHHEPFILKCWRGSTEESLEMMTVQKGPSFRVLDASKSRSGAIWFASQCEAGAQDYANDHGEIIITYPLKCDSYYDIVQYSNGETSKEPNKEMLEKVNVYSESPFMVCGSVVLKAPDGWMFSEQRHVLCLGKLMIRDDMISRR